MRVLHVTAQRPSHTGSGTTLANLVAIGVQRGLTQHVACGLPAGAEADLGVPCSPLRFETDALPFPLPGMSDVMPYPSSRWRDLSTAQVAAYCQEWRSHLGKVIADFRPEVIHSHHLWVATGIATEFGVPVVAHCHATGIRQRALAPGLIPLVDHGVQRVRAVVTLTNAQRREVEATWPGVCATTVGVGFREEFFHQHGRAPIPGRITYVGKLARSKGLPWLLEAIKRLRRDRPEVTLRVCGLGHGDEGEQLAAALSAAGHLHDGMLRPSSLAERLRESEVFVLPSLYEGYGLVLVEALACGNRLVATAFPAATEELAPRLGSALTLVPMPARVGPDEPHPDAEGPFVATLVQALRTALDAGPVGALPLDSWSWTAVFERVQGVWAEAARTA